MISNASDSRLSKLLSAFESFLHSRGYKTIGTRPLARTLGVDNTTLHRLLTAIRSDEEAVRTRVIPGSQGLRRLLWAMEKHAQQPLPAVRAALEAYEIDNTNLRSKGETLDHNASCTNQSDPTHPYRRAAFGPASRIAGCSYGELMYIHVMQPIRDQPELMQLGHGVVFGGIRSYDKSVVLPIHMKTSAGSQSPGIVQIDELSSSPTLVESAADKLSLVQLPADEHGRTHHSVHIEPKVLDAWFTVAYASGPLPHPCHDPEPFYICSCVLRVPARRLTIDLWVHESMVSTSAPEGISVWMQAEVPLTPRAFRARRFPVPVTVQLGISPLPRLDRELQRVHARLTDQLLLRTALPAEQFRLVRAVCAYPILGMNYALIQEFDPNTQTP